MSANLSGRIGQAAALIPPLIAERTDCPLEIWGHREAILHRVASHQVVLVSGPTGVGKTTQMPQLLLDSAAQQQRPCRIICVQPRRISAVAVAERIAYERGEKVGETVGYQIRLESRVSLKSLLLVCTNGVLLRSLSLDGNVLNSATHVILDEIHTRNVEGDLLLAKLRGICQRNPNLKLILLAQMSQATQAIISYFPKLMSYQIPVKIQEVHDYHVDDIIRLTSYPGEPVNAGEVDLNLVLYLVMGICNQDIPGSILVLLPSYHDMCVMRDMLGASEIPPKMYSLHMIHANMVLKTYASLFQPSTDAKVRRLVLSTNIAEFGMCIPDVVFVIDTGKIKQQSASTGSHGSVSQSYWISKETAQLRKEMAGRNAPGFIYRLYTYYEHLALANASEPEILRQSLQHACLLAKLLAPSGYSIGEFLATCISPPPAERVQEAVRLLKHMGAIENEETLTDLGNHLSALPLEPYLCKMVLYGIVLKCLDPVLTIACCMAFPDMFVANTDPAEMGEMHDSHEMFCANSHSDHMVMLRAYHAWQKAKSEQCEMAFCNKHFVSAAVMEMIMDTRTLLLGQLRAAGFVRARGDGDIRDLNTNSENWAVVKGALIAGCYPFVAHYDNLSGSLSAIDNEVNVHSSSVLCNREGLLVESLPVGWMVYQDRKSGGDLDEVAGLTAVTPVSIFLFAGLGAENWLTLLLGRERSEMLWPLRERFMSLVGRKMRIPSRPSARGDEDVLQMVLKVLSMEERNFCLTQPVGVGQRPKPLPSPDYRPTGIRIY